MPTSSSSLPRRIADACLRLSPRDLPPQSMDRLRWSALDLIGCAIGGATIPEVGPALALARPGDVHIPGFDLASAALVLGTAGTLFQLHDVFLPGHIQGLSI